MVARLLVITVILWLGTSPTWAQARRDVLGHRVRVIPKPPATRVEGELLAVSNDSVWVLAGSTLASFSTREIARVDVRLRPIGAGQITAWGAIAALAGGVALTAACSSVEGASCAPVLPLSFVAWLLPTGLSAALAGGPAKRGFTGMAIPQQLRAYGRFPQGLPEPFDPAVLGVTPPR